MRAWSGVSQPRIESNIFFLKLRQTNFYLEVNFPLVTTDFSLVSLAFVGQFLLDERLQVSKESGEV